MNKISILHHSIRFLDILFRNVMLAAAVMILMYVLYIEFDNYRMITDADSTKYISYKPVSDDTLSFEELRKINPDVIGWITIDGTNIDYPIVQGKDNGTYINQNVMGEFSLSGAIFLDARNQPDFSDNLSVIYGHNMTGNMMFGGLKLFEDEEYFQTHRTGTLFHDENYYQLEIFSCFPANGYDKYVYRLPLLSEQYPEWLSYITERSVQKAEAFPIDMPVLLMSTCAVGETDGRTLLACAVRPGGIPMKSEQKNDTSYIFKVFDSAWQYANIKTLLTAGCCLTILTISYIRHRRKGAFDHAES